VAALACICLAIDPRDAVRLARPHRSLLALAITGGALMLHDWKDRPIWFERGRGTQR
jgi:hypothetical protein